MFYLQVLELQYNETEKKKLILVLTANLLLAINKQLLEIKK